MHDAYLMLAVAEGFGESPVPQLLTPDVDPVALLLAPPEPPDVPPRVAWRLRQRDLPQKAARIRSRCDRLGLRILTPADDDWPERIGEQPCPPLVLFARGDPGALRRQPAAAVVGSRTPTPYGLDAATAVATALARASTVLWSGLARGIDKVAHERCLQQGTPTVAVLAGGLDELYPPEHQQLADRIAANGCLISELPPGVRARRGHFVRRNRLLAAGPRVVVVVEGSLTSGALHTARFAADCDTDVYAVPGPWLSERSQGCHRLISEGCGIVESPQALLQAPGLTTVSPDGARDLELDAEQQGLMTLLASGPRPTDLLRRESGLDEAAFVRALFALQHRGAVARMPGDLWRATSR